MLQAGIHIGVTLQYEVVKKGAKNDQRQVPKQVTYLCSWDTSGEAMISVRFCFKVFLAILLFKVPVILLSYIKNL